MQKCEPISPLIQSIVHFVSQSRGLSFLESGANELTICQNVDGKYLTVDTNTIAEVLSRKDSKQELFYKLIFLMERKLF